MKIRTDFVTNSSSTSYICINVTLKDGVVFSGECDVQCGYGTDFGHATEFSFNRYTESFKLMNSGEDIVCFLEKEIGEYIGNWMFQWKSQTIISDIEKIDSVENISSIEISERIEYDCDPEYLTTKYTFDFNKSIGHGMKEGGINIRRITSIDDGNIEELIDGGTLTIPGEVDEIEIETLNDWSKEINNVVCQSRKYKYFDDVLYDDCLEKLIYYFDREGIEEYEICNHVSKIGYLAFQHVEWLKVLTIPDSVTEIDDYSICDCDDLIIKCRKGSVAEQYAIEKNIPFIYEDEIYDAFDTFEGKIVCLTGDFNYGSKDSVKEYIQSHGGEIAGSVNMKCNMVLVGALGSTAWCHNNYGKKVEKAMEAKSSGRDMRIVRELDAIK